MDRVLLIVKTQSSKKMRIMVKLHTRELCDKFNTLINCGKEKEAFKLCKQSANVEAYFLNNEALPNYPFHILVEK